MTTQIEAMTADLNDIGNLIDQRDAAIDCLRRELANMTASRDGAAGECEDLRLQVEQLKAARYDELLAMLNKETAAQ